MKNISLVLLLAAGCTRAVHVEMTAPDLATAARDLGSGDLAKEGDADLGHPDLELAAPITAQPIWIGSGGSAASATQELNLGSGGFDTSGTVSAPSGAQLTSGFFAHQIN